MAFAFPPRLTATHLAIVGKTGSGKTFTAKSLVEGLLSEVRRVCVLDPTGVWWGLRSSADGKSQGFSIVVFGGPHADVHIGEHSGAAVAKLIGTKNLPAIIDLSELLIGQRQRFVTDFAEAIYRENRSPLHLVIDEADEFCPQNPLPETKRLLHHVDRIVRRGRVRGFRVMMLTQRPATLHKNVLTQANALIAMRLTAPQDRNAIMDWVKGQADEVEAAAVLGSLAKLTVGEGWLWAPELGVLERARFPAITTFDSSRTPEDDEDMEEPAVLADVDLREVEKAFERAAEEAKSIDTLRAELAAAQRELEELRARPPAGVSEEEVARRVGEAAAQMRATIFPSLLSILEVARQAVETHQPPGGSITTIAEMDAESGRPALPVPDETFGKLPQFGPLPSRQPQLRQPPRESEPTPKPPAAGLSAPQQRILDTLAQLEMLKVTAPAKVTLAVHAGASSRSSAYANNLGALRTKGLISYPSGGCVALTDEGRKVARRPPRPPTRADLHASWMRMVPRPQAAILEHLIKAYPGFLSKQKLAELAGASATSSAYANNLGSLRTMGALDYPQPGMVKATPILFP